MTAHVMAIYVLLGIVVLASWLGVLGMLRMPHPTQALQYVALPATAGIASLIIAVFLQTGIGPPAWKTLLIGLVLLAVNAVVTHATARAFRTRALGHWEPLEGDPIEFVPSTHHPAGSAARPAEKRP